MNLHTLTKCNQLKAVDYKSHIGTRKSQKSILQNTLESDGRYKTWLSYESPIYLGPKKKLCDITGMEGLYTDPQTSLNYHSMDVYKYIKSISVAQTQCYLELRNAQTIMR